MHLINLNHIQRNRCLLWVVNYLTVTKVFKKRLKFAICAIISTMDSDTSLLIGANLSLKIIYCKHKKFINS